MCYDTFQSEKSVSVLQSCMVDPEQKMYIQCQTPTLITLRRLFPPPPLKTDHCFNPLPFNCQRSNQLKLRRADAMMAAFPLRNPGIFDLWMLLCRVVSFFFCEISGIFDTFTQGLAWWDLPCCERQKSPANLAAFEFVFLNDSDAELPCNSIRMTGEPKCNSQAVAFTSVVIVM